ncbi:MAG: 30S ribosomal protein S6 [Fimbriimonadaceae bacterium]|nr:30S ribosomal protein S6 [Fimbriimonadaceae bacterium]
MPRCRTTTRFTLRKYEAIYIVPASLSDSEVQTVADEYKSVVEKLGGKVEKAGLWEKRKLAYEIEGHKDGNYILMNFEAAPDIPTELSRLMGINDTVVRHRIYVMEPEQ